MGGKKLGEIAEHYDTTDISQEIAEADLKRHEPLSSDELMIVSSIRLPKSTMDEVRAAAAELGVKPTALIRSWIEERLGPSEAATPLARRSGHVATQHSRP
ncbi:hypothetical protein GCM10023196_056620 [Actinoallomurus vinaceus]|uniref:CopG family transcriptional regulator n=1 Tax=Actinoallomurus vinaceus TaxID=1080074 RepID=A0ABP8UHN7_9ACTN